MSITFSDAREDFLPGDILTIDGKKYVIFDVDAVNGILRIDEGKPRLNYLGLGCFIVVAMIVMAIVVFILLCGGQ